MSYNLVDPTTGDLTRVAGNSNIVDTAIETTSTWSSSKIYSAINSIGFKGDAPENANSATTPGVYLINRNDDAYPVRQGYLIVSKPKQDYDCILQEVYYFNANIIYSRGCWFNSWYDWQQLVTNDDIFLVGDRRNTIGWADLSNDVNIDGSSNYANNVGRIEGHNAIIEVSNPSIGYQWPVTNSGDRNNFMDFGGAIQYFVDKVNNHLYVRFADSVDMSAWGKVCTTSVADVPLTYINTFEDETYVKPASDNVCSYFVSNGNCIISIETSCLSTSTTFSKIISGLPKPKTTLYANAIDRIMSTKSGARGLFQLTRNGDLNVTCDYGDSSVSMNRNFYVSFSYLVAES